MFKRVKAGVLNVAYEHHGSPDSPPVILLHGFPYDVHACDEVTPLLVAASCRVIAPYLRGYGPTRFLSDDTPARASRRCWPTTLLALIGACTSAAPPGARKTRVESDSKSSPVFYTRAQPGRDRGPFGRTHDVAEKPRIVVPRR